MAVVGFCGSRSLPSWSVPGGLVSRVVGSVASCGRAVAVGDCVGADAAVLSARLRLPFRSSTSGPSLSVFAVGGPSSFRGSFASQLASFAGFWSGSAVGLLRVAAARVGSPGHGCFTPVSVRWWAGGDASVPLRSRLAGRSDALLSSLPGSRHSALVAFVAPGASVGTWRSVRVAVGAGVPVFVFPVGASGRFLPAVAGGGWVPGAASGVWSRSFRWVPVPSRGAWVS